ncbi:MAG: DUF6206 family protein [Flammeovirgaceae bacterium]
MDILNELEHALSSATKKQSVISKLGFFSKPFRLTTSTGDEWVVKTYKPIGNKKLIQAIIQNHEEYVAAMTAIGVKIPHTEIHVRKVGSKQQLIVVQAPFKQEELVRGIMEEADEATFLHILGLLLKDTLAYWNNKQTNVIGFHPTLRNYALRDNQLSYFDTFPPMLMPQQELNAIILAMAPVKMNLQGIIPLSAINRVSDEYYQKDKMLTGIIGSCCRLRPEFTNQVLDFSREFIAAQDSLTPVEKDVLIAKVQAPPKLPAIWVFIRKLLGKQGKPNLKK